jgi:hypothetical protein
MDHPERITALHIQVTLNEINEWKFVDYAEVPLTLVKRQKWVTHARLLSIDVPMLAHCTWSN